MTRLSIELPRHVIGWIYRERVKGTTHPPLSICSGEKGWGGGVNPEETQVDMIPQNDVSRLYPSLLT